MIPWALNSGLTNIAQSMTSIFRLTGLSNWLPQTMYQGPCAWSENPEHPLFVWKPRLPDPGSDYFNITTTSSDGALDVRPTPASITYFDPTDHYLTIPGKIIATAARSLRPDQRAERLSLQDQHSGGFSGTFEGPPHVRC
jgi:hypothetical protein